MKELLKNEKSRLIIGIAALFLIVILVIFGIHQITTKFRVENFKREIDINYGDEFKLDSGKVCYGSVFNCNKVKVTIEKEIDTKELGRQEVVYKYTYKKNTMTLKQNVNILDKEAPVIKIEDSNIDVCPNNKIINNKIKFKATDNYDGDITDKAKTKIEDNYLVISVTDSSDNTTTEKIDIKKEDKEAPIISIIGDDTIKIKQDSKYKEYGASAKDNCDDVKVDIKSKVDTSKPGTYNVVYSATDKSENTSTKKRIVIVEKKEESKKNSNKNSNNNSNKNSNVIKTKIKDKNPTGKKIIYLTFDDGPSKYTGKLLDILKKYNVKVTFFVTCYGDDAMILREYQEGHQIALHTASHDYSYVYKSVDNYYKDLYKVRDRVKRITGKEVNLIRFPGGSSNTVSRKYDGGKKIMSILTKDVQEKGFRYFDWNVSSGDAGATTSTDKVYSNVVNHLRKDESIVLQHDSKGYSVNAVEKIIKFGLDNGYTFKTLDENSYGAHHGVNN